MTVEGLGFINSKLEAAEIPYEYGEWTSGLSFPYCVGEYSETSSSGESGQEDGVFMITITDDKNLLNVEEIKEIIKTAFPPVGETAILESGSGIAVMYDTSLPIMTGEQGLYRLQVNLLVAEWRL